jgi:hypothetical protein
MYVKLWFVDECVGKILLRWCVYVGKILVRWWVYVGKILLRWWVYVGNILLRWCVYVGKILVRWWVYVGKILFGWWVWIIVESDVKHHQTKQTTNHFLVSPCKTWIQLDLLFITNNIPFMHRLINEPEFYLHRLINEAELPTYIDSSTNQNFT